MPTKRFLTLDDLAEMPKPVWLIEGLFEAHTLTMLAGPSYSFKSFMLLDWLLCMAVGRSWNGRKTAHCKVGYVLGEGMSSLLKRVLAWQQYHDLTPEEVETLKANFRVTFEVPQLVSKASVDNMLADMNQEDFKPEVIAIDTFARSFVGGDENVAKDTGLWVEQADRLRQLGYAVLFLHHTKKNTEFGVQYRGSTAIMGAMDTAMTLVRDDNLCTLTLTKQKDHDEGAPMRFRRVLVQTGLGDDSCVLVPAPVMDSRFEAPIPEFGTPTRESVDDVLAEVLEDATYHSDRERAVELADRTGISIGAAQVRISRAQRRDTV